ncbi:MAG: hypothetical protein H0U80_02770 [Solirubrobacterales bacterium]|nr:hypothetical protein [Solirubrobacterales bacterium]
MTLSIRSAAFPVWTGIYAPTAERPFWHEADSTRHSFASLSVGLDDDLAAELRDMHTRAVATLVGEALKARGDGDHVTVHRLSHASGRLCQEIAGLWPPSAVAIPKH